MSAATSPSYLTDERLAIIDAARTFAEREFGTSKHLEELTDGHAHSHNRELSHKLGELGYIGVGLPEEVGGGGGSIVDTCILMEEIFYARATDQGLHVDDRGRGS